MRRFKIAVIGIAIMVLLAPVPASAVASKKKRAVAPKAKVAASKRKVIPVDNWREPSFADSSLGDNIEGEDLVVRKAAVDALGPFNGSIVVSDPQSGRILTIVNQKLGLRGGFQPCSTIKLVCAMAGLSEGVIDRNSMIRVDRYSRLNLTEALAHSNNPYFANVGSMLGYDRVTRYSKMFGLGEKAGLDIAGEKAGDYPTEAPKYGGVGMMTSYGLGITVTPLELASILGTISNGGTMYYLQYPKNAMEIARFKPRVKRLLDIGDQVPEIKPGMMAAVEYGTARRAAYDPNEPILGKTGTCTDKDSPTHLGWFGSFNEVGHNKLVVVVLLTGGKQVNGGVAAGVAGNVYRNLSRQQFFAAGPMPGLTGFTVAGTE